MKTLKIFLSLFVFSLISATTFAQLRVDSGGDVGVGTTTPNAKLDVVGSASVRGDSLNIGEEAGGNKAKLQIGAGRQSDGQASFELIADAGANPDWGFRFNRFPNGFTNIDHRSGASCVFNNRDNAATFFSVSGNSRVKIGSGIFELYIGNAVKPGGGSWAAPSDKRLKNDVKSYELGLNEIMKIEPVTFKYNGKAGTPKGEEFVGLIAQEVQKVVPYMVKDYTYENAEKTVKEDYLSVDDSAIKYMLINAVKEQETKITKLEERLARMEALLDNSVIDLGNGQTINNHEISLDVESVAKLGQNEPNPFNSTTNINYFVPKNSNTSYLRVFDLNGQILKHVTLAPGTGNVKITAGEFPSGQYTYNLVIDGQIVDTKKMVLTK